MRGRFRHLKGRLSDFLLSRLKATFFSRVEIFFLCLALQLTQHLRSSWKRWQVKAFFFSGLKLDLDSSCGVPGKQFASSFQLTLACAAQGATASKQC